MEAMASEQTAATVWDEQSLRNPHEADDKARRVEAMFDAIAPTYERVNRVATFGMDAAWRRRAIASTRPQAGEVVLDVCCGTGDMIREFARQQPKLGHIIGLDFSGPMLAAGRYPDMPTPYTLVRADGLRLPLRDASVDIVSCAFGVRNFQRLADGLNEMGRVVRPGGRVAILEFANPENPALRWGYRLYCETILPRLGAWIARDRVGAYKYLPKSIETFETRRSMCEKLTRAGFGNVRAQGMNMGGVVLYTGVRAAGAN
jgi:demethylmenaquinone methyltransferase/2-methoxy-6-polyprenyl-1,4-benzoquinol methylase